MPILPCAPCGGSHIYSWILLSFTEPTLQLSAATLLPPVCGFTSHHSALCHAPPALFPPAMARYRQRPLPASSDFGYDPLQGTRVGEASHPGPHKPSFRCAILNPTALRGKTPELLSLDADLLCVAETSAVDSVQRETRYLMQSAGYKSFFSPPVPFLLTDASPEAAVRGQAGGVAIFTRTPSRPPLRPVPAPMLQTTRIQTCFTRVGALEIRVICVYGLPSSHPGANDVNDHLMRSALELTQQSQVPAIVAGDWNCEVHTLPTWSAFQQMGYVEAFSAVAARLHITLPPTCKGATFNDTALLAPSLVALLSGAQVLSDQHIFDAHAPLILDFSEPCQLPATRRWNHPNLGMTSRSTPRSWQVTTTALHPPSPRPLTPPQLPLTLSGLLRSGPVVLSRLWMPPLRMQPTLHRMVLPLAYRDPTVAAVTRLVLCRGHALNYPGQAA